MKPIVIVPARLKSLRLPNKILMDIHGLPMIEHVRRRILISNLIDDVYIATCDIEIKEALEVYGAKVIMTSENHKNGTSRVAEAVKSIDCDKLILVQGDEPLLLPSQLDQMVKILLKDNDSKAWNATGPIENEEEFSKKSFVKCSLNDSKILNCFRSLPSSSDFDIQTKDIRKILGIIAFTKEFLLELSKLKSGKIESTESIEQMRILENGYSITSIPFDKNQASINEPDDLEIVLQILNKDKEQKELLTQVLEYKY
tara:strand:- start:4522 stop:5292 length:771 start_codon:yes stop_codon:yes gene_type:complete